ncbi:hypothetical protein DFJ74DRAFT_11411 [Hyaloraphidium curvatum]|nr:hypothetical protein DFJ74DRAFT_11411 [Hyaloraphidium curvatum]
MALSGAAPDMDTVIGGWSGAKGGAIAAGERQRPSLPARPAGVLEPKGRQTGPLGPSDDDEQRGRSVVPRRGPPRQASDRDPEERAREKLQRRAKKFRLRYLASLPQRDKEAEERRLHEQARAASLDMTGLKESARRERRRRLMLNHADKEREIHDWFHSGSEEEDEFAEFTRFVRYVWMLSYIDSKLADSPGERAWTPDAMSSFNVQMEACRAVTVLDVESWVYRFYRAYNDAKPESDIERILEDYELDYGLLLQQLYKRYVNVDFTVVGHHKLPGFELA